MNLLARTDDVRKLWRLLLPHVEAPTDEWIAKWCAVYVDDVIERSITKAARKFRDPASVISAELVHRYTSAVLKSTAAELRAEAAVCA